ncbi:MAG: hypothetical protein K5981_06140, partial [Clostridia bacterium]|nr:hypothetical protein [Clostridia bacterium]
PTPQALIRFGAAKDLFCSVLTAPGPGHCVENGGTLSYTAVVENRGEESRAVTVRFEAGTGSQAEGLAEKTMELKPGETGSCVFCAKACTNGPRIEPPRITVNGLAVWAPRVNVGGSANGSPAPESFSMAPEEVSGRLHDLFFLHDTELADVVSRRPQDPAQDGCAYGLYGGLGVISPQNATGADIRETYLDETYLEPGDILLTADDALFLKSYACLWTGKELIGQFEAEGEAGRKAGEDARVWIDSLPGRFCFAVLRPALQKGESR